MSNGHKITVDPQATGSCLDLGTVVRVVTAAGITRAEGTAVQGDTGTVTGVSAEGFYCIEFTGAGNTRWVAVAVRPDEIAGVRALDGTAGE